MAAQQTRMILSKAFSGLFVSAHFADSPVSVREQQVDTLNLHHRQLIEATLICLEAIG